jgi:stage II sporulation protein D
MRTRLPIAPLLALWLCLLMVTPAEARVTWLVNGRGFGHGVGMSQYGAYGFALHGKGHRFILRHYYPGTSLGELGRTPIVRVLVDISGGDVRFGGARRACGVSLDPRRTYAAHRVGGGVRLRGPGGRHLASCGRGLRAAGNGTIRIGPTVYRGALEVVPTSSDAGSLNAVNAVPLDQYLKGVVPNEVPASWPLAALRAQAIAARSYALTGRVDGNGFDLYEDTRSQVYDGVASEDPRTNRAVEETRRVVVRYGGEVAQTFFSACSGGHTESVQHVFFGPAVPYLVGVPDPYDHLCPLHTWTLRFSGPEISAKLDSYLLGRLRRVVVTKRGASPRIVWARLHGTGGVTKIRGDQLAAALGGYDRWMTFRKVVDGKVGGRPGRRPGGAAADSAVREGLDGDAVVGLPHAELVGGTGG